MMRIIKEEPFQDGLKYIEGFCLSTELKPTTGIITGSKMTEADTGDVYLFAEGDNPAWTKVAAGWVDPNP